jgi:hypothetical protein
MLCSNEKAMLREAMLREAMLRETMLREQGGLHTGLPAFCVSERFTSAQGAAVQISITDALQQ